MTVQALWDDARGTGHTPTEFDAWGAEVTTRLDRGGPRSPGELVFYDDFVRANTTGGLGTPQIGPAWVTDTTQTATQTVTGNRWRSSSTAASRSTFDLAALAAGPNNGASNGYQAQASWFASNLTRLEVLRVDADNLYYAGTDPDGRTLKVFRVIDGVATNVYALSGVGGLAAADTVEYRVTVTLIHRTSLGTAYIMAGFRLDGPRGAGGYYIALSGTDYTLYSPAIGKFGLYANSDYVTATEVAVWRPGVI